MAPILGSVSEPKIGGDHYGTFLMALGKHLEEKFRAFPVKRDVAKFIQSQQVITVVTLQKPLEIPFCFGLTQVRWAIAHP